MTTVYVTPRMMQTITALQRFQAEHGRLPSYRELLPGLGLSSMSSVYARVVELDAAGVINRIPGKGRAYGFRPGLTIVCEYPRKERSRVSEESLP